MGYNAVQLMAVAEHAHYGSILSYSRNIDFGFVGFCMTSHAASCLKIV